MSFIENQDSLFAGPELKQTMNTVSPKSVVFVSLLTSQLSASPMGVRNQMCWYDQ